MLVKKIKKILIVSTKEFPNEIKTIKEICNSYEIKEEIDNITKEMIFYFYDNKSWYEISQEIQLKVENVILKPKTKCVIIEKKMKSTIDQPIPQYFTKFQKEMWGFKQEMQEFKQEMLEFKKEMLDFKQEMLDFKREMQEFKQIVIQGFKAINDRIDNLVKVNNLKE